jgi:pimeloyl-ACP methyl ester carboxylesterase
MQRLLILPFVLLGTVVPAAVAAPAIELTPARRQQIDRMALKAALENTAERSVDLAGNLGAWVLRQVILTAEEERDAARAANERILRQQKGRVRPAPRTVRQVFDLLVKELPPHLGPSSFRFTLTVLEDREASAFTVGGGYVYATTGLLDALLADRKRGPAALAFFLAHELGHGALGHARRGYQLQELEKELKKEISMGVDRRKLRSCLETSLAPAGKGITFLYSREQHHEADLFALHLCVNAGFDPDQALDGLRWLVAARKPDVLNGDTCPGERPSLLSYYFTSHPDPARRLKRLLLEQAGTVEDEKQFGLFAFDPVSGEFTRCPDGTIHQGKRSVVFIHGLHGDEHSFDAFLNFVSRQKKARNISLLLFRYPGNGSLIHAGRYLRNEMARVVCTPEKAAFVCHSAGGLVFRWYAEKEGGAFDRAVLLGTPHGGSRLTSLQFILDLLDFARDAPLGLPKAIITTVKEGRGAMNPDLDPDSLFLRALGRDARLARRYHVVYGRYFTPSQAVTLALAFHFGKGPLQKAIESRLHPGLLRDQCSRLVEQMELPAEVLDGDLIVSTDSARLKGAGKTTGTHHHHQELKTEKDVMRLTVQTLFGSW